MACEEKVSKVQEEMEEGEIVDDLDDLSDISSEEEFLLRQRLEVLENYNNVLERTKAKRSSIGPGKPKRDTILFNVSEISSTDLENTRKHATYKNFKIQRHIKPHNNNRHKHRKEIQHIEVHNVKRKKEHRKKSTRNRKKIQVKIISDSSSDEEDEYRNKRKKLSDAVVVNQTKGDKSSLSARLHQMLHGSEEVIPLTSDTFEYKNCEVDNNNTTFVEGTLSPNSPSKDHLKLVINDPVVAVDVPDGKNDHKNKENIFDSIDLLTDDDDVKMIISHDVNFEKDLPDVNADKLKDKSVEKGNSDNNSDEDLELLRQHALKSKSAKPKIPERNGLKLLSDDEDSDTAELRAICLKSALLKKAIELKQKQKMQKRLSQSSTLEDELFKDSELYSNKCDSDNNTDIGSVDMDMESDADEKLKESNDRKNKRSNELNSRDEEMHKDDCSIDSTIKNVPKEDELEEDEDLLRAKLLTSLSKNLPNLISPESLHSIKEVKNVAEPVPQIVNKSVNVPEEKRFIIKLDESDSEGEHEATKNLTKMHMKLSEQLDFQQKLDIFLKSTRLEVEKKKFPDVIENPPTPKKSEKFVAKAVNHLPKSEQMEYKNLVRRMAELEKIKQTRQASMSLMNKLNLPLIKETLKPHNNTISTQVSSKELEEQIAKSRKRIADESAKMLKLKEESIKLSQKYKIAATELRNITTAITLNKKQQRQIHNSLSKIRLQHQSLLKSTTNSLHSKLNGRKLQLNHLDNKAITNESQKENNPKDDYKNIDAQKSVKITVTNDFKPENPPKISVQIDVAKNKKIVTQNPVNNRINLPNETTEEQEVRYNEENEQVLVENDHSTIPEVEKREGDSYDTDLIAVCDHGNKRYYISVNDYKSPLDALGNSTWQADPNAILCPFEVDGQCKDTDCKFLHTRTEQ